MVYVYIFLAALTYCSGSVVTLILATENIGALEATLWPFYWLGKAIGRTGILG